MLSGVKITPENTIAQGRFTKIIYNDGLDRLLLKHYGRSGLCLKVMRLDNETWEGASIDDTIRLQNLAAINGVAPRVYDFVKLTGGQTAQVTDYVELNSEPSLQAIGNLLKFLAEYDVGTRKLTGPDGKPKYDMLDTKNWSDYLFLDWGGLYLKNPQDYLEKLLGRAAVKITRAGRGEPTGKTYQSLDDLGMFGSRDMGHRLEVMQLDKINFVGKTVLDLGNNLGLFCHYADRRGAKRVVGVDLPILEQPAKEIANWVHRWNVDFLGLDLPGDKDKIEGRFDIIFAFSICNHIGGYQKWIAELCSDLMILEGHGGDKVEKYYADLCRDFRKVEVIGYTTDSMTRPVFRCEK